MFNAQRSITPRTVFMELSIECGTLSVNFKAALGSIRFGDPIEKDTRHDKGFHSMVADSMAAKPCATSDH